MINLGNIEIADLRLGASQVKALYLGSEQVWSGEEPTPVTGPWLCFTAAQANSTVHLDKVGSPDAISLETSTDGSTWTDYSWTDSTGDTLTLTNVGDKVYFRAKTENQTIGSSDSNHYTFVMSGQIAASGNIQTLLKADGSRTDAPTYCFGWLFERCTSLTTASITLPATALGARCYQDLFAFCSSLTTAPAVLPATTLADACYAGMFHHCSALTTAPKILATTLANAWNQNMFLSCSALSSVEVAFTSWTKTSGWLINVASTGTFYCPTALGTNETIQRGNYYCPTNWTVVNT